MEAVGHVGKAMLQVSGKAGRETVLALGPQYLGLWMKRRFLKNQYFIQRTREKGSTELKPEYTQNKIL